MKQKYDFEDDKRRWHEICQSEEFYVPIYHKDWYWDAVCDSPTDWRVIVYEDRDVIAALPFQYRKIHGIWRIENPWQVARGGIWFDYKKKNFTLEKKNQIQVNILDTIFDRLPEYDYFNIIFWPEYSYILPLYWKGFSLSVYNNHYFKDKQEEDIKSNCTPNRRKRINTGIKNCQIKVNEITVDEYWDFYEKVSLEKGRKISYGKTELKKLILTLQEKQSVILKCAYKEGGLKAAAIYLEDEKSIYHQFTATVPKDKDSQSLLTFDTIVKTLEKGKKFDFEGSMIKGVAEFNLSFSPETELCYRVYKENRKYERISAVKKLIRGY